MYTHPVLFLSFAGERDARNVAPFPLRSPPESAPSPPPNPCSAFVSPFSSTSPSVATSLLSTAAFNPSLVYPYAYPYPYYHPHHQSTEPFLPHHPTVYCYPPPNTPSYSSGSPAAVITPDAVRGFQSPTPRESGGESRGASPVDYKDDSDKEGSPSQQQRSTPQHQQQLVSINPLVHMAALNHRRVARGHHRSYPPIYDIPFQDRRETAANA